MKRPLISIITICKNSEATIERTIKSVVTQDYESFEYIIIDGGSSDNTLEIVSKYKDKIHKIVSEPDNGISDAFNKGIALSNGEIVGIINSDDGLLPDALRIIAENYEESVDVYRGITVLWEEKSGTKFEEWPSMHLKFYGKNHICHQSTFIKKTAYDRVGMFNTEYKYSMDYDLLLRLQQNGMKFKLIQSPLAFYSLAGRTSGKFTKERQREIDSIIRNNGGTNIDVMMNRLYHWIVCIIKIFVPKKVTMKIR